MASTPCRSAALDGIIAPWAAKIVAFWGAIVETILTIAENIRNPLPELGACCRKAAPGAVSPMISELGFLPPSAGARHTLARKRSPEFGQAVMMDLRHDEAQIDAQFAEPSRRLMTFLVRPELTDDIGSGRRACPHVKSARWFGRFVNPLSATEH